MIGVNQRYRSVNQISAGDQSIADSRLGLCLCLPVIANLGFDDDRPSVRLLDKNVRSSAFLEYPSDMLRTKSPCAAKRLENFTKSGIYCLLVSACPFRSCHEFLEWDFTLFPFFDKTLD